MGINREYFDNFQNKLLGSFSKWVPKYLYSVPSQTGGRSKVFLERKSIDLQLIPWTYLLHVGVMLTIIKEFINLFLIERIGNILNIFKVNQIKFCFQWVLPIYFVKWNRYFSAIKRKCLESTSQFYSNLASTSVPSNITPLYFF